MPVRTSHTIGSKEGSSTACFTCYDKETGALILYSVAALSMETMKLANARAYQHDSIHPTHDILTEFVHVVRAE